MFLILGICLFSIQICWSQDCPLYVHVLVLLGPQLQLATTTPIPGSPKTDTNDGDVIKEILNVHNELRAKIPATWMYELVWDPEAAADGAKWLEKCVFRHPSQPGDMDFIQPKRPGTGQNLFAGSGDMPYNWTTAIKAWYSEVAKFRLGGPNNWENIGHYTALVWSDTYAVGCAYRRCTNHHYVCNYYPAGNYDVNRPYVPGPACLKCPNNCRKGLCTNPCKVSDNWGDCQTKYFPDGCPPPDKLSADQKPAYPNCNATCQCLPQGLLVVQFEPRGGAGRNAHCFREFFLWMLFVIVSVWSLAILLTPEFG